MYRKAQFWAHYCLDFCVSLSKTFAVTFMTGFGVPQDSVLGTLLSRFEDVIFELGTVLVLELLYLFLKTGKIFKKISLIFHSITEPGIIHFFEGFEAFVSLYFFYNRSR